jgi:hypothetical protein
MNNLFDWGRIPPHVVYKLSNQDTLHPIRERNHRRMMELVMEGFQGKMNVQVLAPLGSTTAAMTAVINRLENLVESNPTLIEQGF